ncbi:Rieske (2Fe-2S) protein [Castellaniella defragrans]|nr:Rieske (2Fe-2S) protein [Castellaniella defragrans]
MGALAEARAGTAGWIRLCPAGEVSEGLARGFDPLGEDRDTVFVVRQAGALHAWRNSCPHIPGAPMAWRKDAYMSGDGTRIVCSAHGARFLPGSGLCVQGPCRGESLTPVPLRVDERGEIHIYYDKSEEQ